jgi:CelD/BcsL family acetyltransferase involved in cellulose biosynthesis
VKPAKLQTTRIDSPTSLFPYLDPWRKLAGGAPMRSPEWLLSWWEDYATPDDELYILLIHEPKGSLVGLAPLYLQGVGSSKTFRLLGSGDACTTHTTWLSAAGWETRVGKEVARFLLECETNWKRLVFESVDVDATAVHSTVNCLAENGCLRHSRRINNCWRIHLPDTWEDYLQSLSRSLRKRCRKLQRQFFDSGKIRVRQVESEADLRKGFDVLLKLHAARWGNNKKPLGVFEDQRFRNFHKKVSRKFLARDKLRLAWLECHGDPIAVEYQFVGPKAVYAYQAGIDLEMNEYAPGKLTMMAAIQYSIEQGFKYLDLLRGDEPYKSHWRAVPKSCHDLRVWKKQPVGLVEWTMWSGYTWMVRRLTPVIPPRLINMGLRLFGKIREEVNTLCQLLTSKK